MKDSLVKTLPSGPRPPGEIYCLVEIPKGGTNKYEYDEEMGVFRLDRVLYEAVFYPTEYGIIPQTLNKSDGDPLDVMLFATYPSFPGCLVACRPIGVLKIEDTGEEDDKILAVPIKDPRFAEIKELDDLPEHLKKEIVNFWENYVELQPKKTIKVKTWGNRETAERLITKAIENFKETLRD